MRRYDKLRRESLKLAVALSHDMGYFMERSVLKEYRYSGRAYCIKCNAYIEIRALINHIEGTAIVIRCADVPIIW